MCSDYPLQNRGVLQLQVKVSVYTFTPGANKGKPTHSLMINPYLLVYMVSIPLNPLSVKN